VIVAMHRIPGKYGSPRPTVIKFLGIDTTITFLYKKKKLNDASEVKIGDDITKQNQGFINTNVDIHVHLVLGILVNMCFGTDENGTRQIFEYLMK
jgi:hypothetical protein